MNRLALALGAIGLALLASAGAQARDQLNDKDPVRLDPAKAYIYFHMPKRTAIAFLREVTPEERKAWEARRAEALVKARANYERDLARYRKAMETYSPNPSLLPPEKPTPVTDESFAFAPPEMGHFVNVSPGPQFSKAPDDYAYLIAVEPGTYSLYGEMTAAPGLAAGTCVCMGSVKFEAKAGEVTDVGAIGFPRAEAIAGGAAADAQKTLLTPWLAVRPAASVAAPDRLKDVRIVPAELRAADKQANMFGVLISRLAPIEGVLAYDRDKVVDPRGGR